MAGRRTLAALVAALALPMSMTAGSICDLSCSLQAVDADCQMTTAAAPDNTNNQTGQFASPATDMQPGMHMDSDHETAATNRANSSMYQCPQCKDDICTQASFLKSVVPRVGRIHVKSIQRMAVGSLNVIQAAMLADWIKRECPPPKITIAFLSANLRV